MKFLEKILNLNRNSYRDKMIRIFSSLKKMNILFGISILVIILFINMPLLRKVFTSKTVVQGTKLQTKNYRQWIRLLKSFPVQNGAFELYEKFSFPKVESEKTGIFLSSPFKMCLDHKGNIFISNHRSHSIHKYDSNGNFLFKIGSGGEGPGEFIKPGLICMDNKNNLFVLDSGNSRINIFGPEGEFIKSFRIFKSYISMAINEQGLILLSPYTSDLKKPLIEVLNQDGNLINFFGKRIEFKQNTIAHNEIFISVNKKREIFIAWINFPIVRRYSEEGRLLSEYKINYKLLKKLAKPNYKMKMIKNKIKVRDVIANIRAKENKFYLLIIHPRIEILEFNLKGELVNIYWKDRPYEFLATDFLISDNTQEKQMLFYILKLFPYPGVKVYSIQRHKRK